MPSIAFRVRDIAAILCAAILRSLLIAGVVGGVSACASARAEAPLASEPAQVAVPGPTEPLRILAGGGEVAFAVEVAQTEPARERGLMYRRELADDAGMLFLFEREQRLAFWMKNTYVPLDMLFIRSTGEIAAIVENTKPLTVRPYSPFVRASAVLEVKAGTAKAKGIAVGDRIDHPAFTGKARRP